MVCQLGQVRAAADEEAAATASTGDLESARYGRAGGRCRGDDRDVLRLANNWRRSCAALIDWPPIRSDCAGFQSHAL
jgi:hypothetical protein